MKLEGNVALITGAARGLGKAFAEGILQHAARAVVLVDILDDVGESTARELESTYSSSSVSYFHADVSQEDQMKEVYEKVIARYSTIDVVINNAGVGIAPDKHVIDVNIGGTINGTELAIQHMTKENGGKGGTIINISSILAFRANFAGPVYHATKGAILSYTRSRALMLGEDTGINVRTLCPGAVKTELTRTVVEGEKAADEYMLQLLIALGGWVEIPDVVEACMTVIEDEDLPQNTIVLVDPKGSWIVHPDEVPCTPLKK